MKAKSRAARARPTVKHRAQVKAPAKPRVKTPPPDGSRVTGLEFATRVGVSKNAASYMTREEGAPYDTHGWRWPEALHWYIRREKARGRPPTGDNVANARDRREMAQAELAELDLAARRGETMTVTQFDAVMSAAFSRVRSRLLNLPGKLAGEGELKPREELLALAERLVHEALEELAAGDDVPMNLEEEPAAA